LAFLALAASLLAGAVPAAAGCFPWSQAGPIIAKNGLISGDAVYQKVQAKTKGKILKATLCQDGGRFYYKFVVVGTAGDVSHISVDAKTGQF
jgi:uncharacterized membrane protein YkoI